MEINVKRTVNEPQSFTNVRYMEGIYAINGKPGFRLLVIKDEVAGHPNYGYFVMNIDEGTISARTFANSLNDHSYTRVQGKLTYTE
jgi:hypothetical protein